MSDERVEQACRRACERLRAAGVQPEPLAELVPEQRRFFIRRPAKMIPCGEVWRIGPLLLGTDGELYATGRITRSRPRGRPGYQSRSLEERRDLAAAALRGGFPEGQTVNFDAVRLPSEIDEIARLDPSLPLGVADGSVRVRWSAGAPLSAAPPLSTFLLDRVDLLVDPPGAAD